MHWYASLADVLVALHVAYVAFIVFGLAAILLGRVAHWQWVRNPWFRVSHLAAILIVALEAGIGMDCPLTVWEARLREAAGQEFSGESFISRMLHSVLFCDCAPATLNAIHIAFGVLVLATFVLAPPRWQAIRAEGVNAESGERLRGSVSVVRKI